MKIRNVHENHEIHNEFEEIIKRAFGSVKFEGGGSTDDVEYRSYLSKNNWNYRGTDYYYSEPLKFFHLTGLGSLFSVLSGRTLRMYDLHSSADENEYRYAAKAMGLKDDSIENLKSRLYTLSFCPFTEINNPLVWEKYGVGGAAIVFEIVNDPKSWINFNLAQIKYKLPPGLENYQTELDQFKKKYRILNATVDASRLLGFYKMEHFSGEKEVRLLRYAPYGNRYEDLKYVKYDYRFDKFEMRNRLTTYIELPLWVNNEQFYYPAGYDHLSIKQQLPSDYFEKHPQIKIVDVRIWNKCGLGLPEFGKLKEQIKNMALFTLGYSINVSEEFFRLE